MNTSEQINEIATALAKAQGEMKNAPLNKTNPHFKSRYADLAAIRDATVPALSKHGISVTQGTEVIAAGMLLCTRLMHSSGQWIESTYPIDADMAKPQAVGSALTYAKRYGLASICGIAADEDDDGNHAQEHSKSNGVRTPVTDKRASAIDARFIYERLVNTMRKTKDEPSYLDWKTRNDSDINLLTEDYFHMLAQESKTHRAGFPKMKLSDKALEADKPLMPDDALPESYTT